jgi:hypothetical protein
MKKSKIIMLIVVVLLLPPIFLGGAFAWHYYSINSGPRTVAPKIIVAEYEGAEALRKQHQKNLEAEEKMKLNP